MKLVHGGKQGRRDMNGRIGSCLPPPIQRQYSSHLYLGLVRFSRPMSLGPSQLCGNAVEAQVISIQAIRANVCWADFCHRVYDVGSVGSLGLNRPVTIIGARNTDDLRVTECGGVTRHRQARPTSSSACECFRDSTALVPIRCARVHGGNRRH